ncbi:MAG: SURF1 family protein [Gammaproteobacteria bacterium]|nr:SURF1 family protein [Gammaproteobacteria bacterium]MBT8109860.1 SURF1 family protein [Gammaproteobacteria bacterium]NND46249.1 SURF1 family protein [Woeseiaceae bacterium]NNL44562.1 SURF1 family protein [Woeseiaceae bacterium]
MNTKAKKPLPAWLPLVVGTLLVAQFAGLGVWQISRGMDKRADRAAFHDESGFAAWQDGMEIRPYQRLRASGRYDTARQILLENIIVNGRYGYYVLTPLIGQEDEPVLLVNRGWIEKGSSDVEVGVLDVPVTRIAVRGRAGSLPRAGYKMGAAIDPASNWPKRAVFPTTEEVSAALGVAVQPFVLLMDHEEEHGFLRQWVPTEFGPGKHFGYAFQWFAMAAVLSGLLVWNYRKKRFNS